MCRRARCCGSARNMSARPAPPRATCSRFTSRPSLLPSFVKGGEKKGATLFDFSNRGARHGTDWRRGRAMSAAPIPPAAIAGAVTAARDFLRSPGDDEPRVMAQFAASALLIGEAFTGTLLIARAVEEAIPAATAWRLLAEAPVRAIDAV